MISITKANAILKNLFGVEGSTLSRPSAVYLGLSATKPKNTGGNLDEPTTVTNANYSRQIVGGTDAKTTYFNSNSAAGGKISNTSEIKFNTAKAAYGKKMNYWFLSESLSGGSAFLWGRLKDVLFEKATRDFETNSAISNTYKFETDVEDLLNMAADTDYVVWWRNPNDSEDAGKEYDVKSTEYSKDGKTYIHIGNPMFKGGTDDGTPFGVLYKQETVGAETTGHIEIYSKMVGTKFEVAVYGLGIDVKKATVPTFYQGELTASIEVQTDND